MAKLQNQYTINLDNETAQAVEKLAQITRRKPAEVLRLLVVDHIFDNLAEATSITSTLKPAKYWAHY